MQVSFSKMKTYLTCPKAYQLLYVNRVKTTTNSLAVKIGSEIHKVLEQTFELAKSMPVNEAFSLALSKLSNEVANDQKTLTLLETFNPEAIFGKSILAAGASEMKIGLTENLMPADFENATFRGVIDLIWIVPTEKGLEANILDFKTNAEKTADVLQLEFYAFLVKHYYKPYYALSKIRVMFYYLLHDDPLEVLEFSPEQVDDRKFLELLQKISQDNEYRPRPGENCRFCNVAYACPLAKEGLRMAQEVENKKELSEDDIKQIAELYLPLKKASEIVETLIKEYIETNGQLVTEHFVFKNQLVKKKVVDVEYAKQLLKMANVTIDDLIDSINLTQSLFKKLNIKLPEEALITKEETRLSVSEL